MTRIIYITSGSRSELSYDTVLLKGEHFNILIHEASPAVLTFTSVEHVYEMDGDPAVEPELDTFGLILPLPFRVAVILVLGAVDVHITLINF